MEGGQTLETTGQRDFHDRAASGLSEKQACTFSLRESTYLA
jgi:hypothetical protein